MDASVKKEGLGESRRKRGAGRGVEEKHRGPREKEEREEAEEGEEDGEEEAKEEEEETGGYAACQSRV